MVHGMRCWLGGIAGLLGLPLLCVLLVLVAANSPVGHRWIEQTVMQLSGGMVVVDGLSGRFPDALRVEHIEIKDSDGLWLTIGQLRLDWSPLHLLAGTAEIDRLVADEMAVLRVPASDKTAPSSTAASLPMPVSLQQLHVGRLVLAAAVAGVDARLGVDGSAQFTGLDRSEFDVSVQETDGAATYTLKGHIDPASVQARLAAHEPARGLLSALVQWPDVGALSLDAALDGPRSALHTQLELAAGPLRAKLHGAVDLDQQALDLLVAASAPAMQPRPGLSWQAMTLEGKVNGPFTAPLIDAHLLIDALNASDVLIQKTSMDLQGDSGQARLGAKLDGIRVPGSRPELFAAAPIIVRAEARLDAPDRPLDFTLRHPLIAVSGKATTSGDIGAEMKLNLLNLAPLAELGGLDVQGETQMALRAAVKDGTTQLDVNGSLAVNTGTAPLPALVGGDGKIALSVALKGADIALSRLSVDGKALRLAASGSLAAAAVDVNWTLGLSDLAALTPALSGQISAQGRLQGPQDQFALNAEVNGDLGAQGLPRGPIAAKLNLQGLPDVPTGAVTARGILNQSPLEVVLKLKREGADQVHMAIERADWKSVHAQGALRLASGITMPVGQVEGRIARLEDLASLLGQPLSGSAEGRLEATESGGHTQARLQLEGRNLVVAGTAASARTALDVVIKDPVTRPLINGRLSLDELVAGAATGALQLEAVGPATALALHLSASGRNVAGTAASLVGKAVVDASAGKAAISQWETRWKGETFHLLDPANIGFAEGLTVDRLRLGWRDAVLEITGRVTPRLDAHIALHRFAADLAGVFVPGFRADGVLQAEAMLTGTLASPRGTVTLEAKGLRSTRGAGHALPPADIKATAELAGDIARIDSRLNAGSTTTLSVTGQAPLQQTAPLDLHTRGAMDLKLLDPVLAAAGRRARGQVSFEGDVTGTFSAPRINGALQWSGGEAQDYAQGAHLSGIDAQFRAEGDTLRIVRFVGRAGPGSLAIDGSVGLLAPGLPADLRFTARNARALASDRLTVNLDADLALRGRVREQLGASGTVRINRADIQIPEHLPASIAVLEVRRPGVPPPVTPPPGPEVALNLAIRAPRQIFVRGRGLDAELGGKILLHGTSAKPQPDGRFELRRGQFSLAGKTLVFSRGQVGFDGGSLTDPSLDFVADTTSNNITATLAVGGTARKPMITLSSVPDLPQDEVLSQLLFGHGTASLGPFEMVQIAAAVGSLTGITPSGGNLMESVRKGLGLDRLALGGGAGGGPTLEVGRYIIPGVAVGAKQGLAGTGTQAVVQIDVRKGLKLETSVGTGSSSTGSQSGGTSSVGVLYQFEY